MNLILGNLAKNINFFNFGSGSFNFKTFNGGYVSISAEGGTQGTDNQSEMSIYSGFKSGSSTVYPLDIESGGGQYPYVNLAYELNANPNDVFAGFQIQDFSNGYFTAIGMAANTYAPETSGSIAGWIGGGQSNDSGSNTAIIFPGDTPNMEVYKPTNFHYPVTISGSVNITDVVNLTPQNPLPSGVVGDLAVSGSNIYFYNGTWAQILTL